MAIGQEIPDFANPQNDAGQSIAETTDAETAAAMTAEEAERAMAEKAQEFREKGGKIYLEEDAVEE